MTEPARRAFPVRVAAIDAGSNAIRFVVADFAAPDSYTIVHKLREPIRLGHRVFTDGDLDDETMARAVAAFRVFRRKIDGLGVERFRAVATSATREASNRDRFLDTVHAESDIVLEPISGAEEARLVHRAVRSRVDLSRGRWILADLGGGSVEISVVDETGILWSESYRLGTVRLLETLAAAAGCHESLRAWVRHQLQALIIPPPRAYRGPTAFAATGGNIVAIAKLAVGYLDPLKPATMPTSRLDAVIHMLTSMTVTERIRELALRPDRADVILPAAMVYRYLAQFVHAEHIVVPRVGVKEGVLLETAAGAATTPTDVCVSAGSRGQECRQGPG
ncbi:MAG: hypothetical protein OXE96_07125 [Gemmatimonadetes bacterium]|nr:hypothetical protein [Gemmatimonadota bacterium]